MDKLIIVVCILLIVLAFVLFARIIFKGLKGRGAGCSGCSQGTCRGCPNETRKTEKNKNSAG